MTATLDQLLRATSRSFFLTLRVLPRRVRPQIGLAYLLARTSDTIADTEVLPVAQRLQALRDFRARIFGQDSSLNFDPFVAHLSEGRDFSRAVVTDQAAEALKGQRFSAAVSGQKDDGALAPEILLLHHANDALAALDALSAADRQLIRDVLSTIISGQELDLQRFAVNESPGAPPLSRASFAGQGGKITALATDAELDDYTYRVAGCVGNFWTRLTRAHLFPRAELSEADAVRFGKGLQLINVLRDVPADLANGRCYLPLERITPVGLTPATLLAPENEARFLPIYRSYLDLAEDHLRAGWRYTNAIPYAQFRVRLACAWPILIGVATITKLRAANVAELQQGIKITRREVRSIMRRSTLAAPLPPLWSGLFPASNNIAHHNPTSS